MDFTKANQLRKQYITQQFSHLNNMQQQAVYHIKGPLLILAGAGSGKTSVLINRIFSKYGLHIFDKTPELHERRETEIKGWLDTHPEVGGCCS